MGALAFAVVSAAVISCNKEKETDLKTPQQLSVCQQNTAEVERILDFKRQVEERKTNPGMKSAEAMTLEDAMNNIVDLFNVTYTEPSACYTESEHHGFTVNVALTADGKVLLDDVVAAYEQALANAREAYHASLLPDKAYQRLIVTYVPQRDGSIDLEFDGKYGTRTDQPQPEPVYNGPFREGDDWKYMDGMGRCDTLCDSGADKELQKVIMDKVIADRPVDPNGCRGFYTNFREKLYSEPLYSGVFYRTDVENTCIGWQEMNSCFNGETRNIYHVIPQELNINLHGNEMQPYRDYVYDVEIEGKEYWAPTRCIRHNTLVIYARYNYINNDVISHLEL